MFIQNLFKKRARMEEARREVTFWVATPTGVIIALLALLGALHSPNVINLLDVTYDTGHQVVVNHSLWWIICTNITGALLTVAVIFWFISLYFDYKSIHHLLSFTRSKKMKYRRQHHLLWTAAALVVIPVIIVVILYAIGAVLQYMIVPANGTSPVSDTWTIVGTYWNMTAPVFETIILIIPFLVVIAIYLLVKRSRL